MGYNTLDGPKGAFWTYQQKVWTEDLLDVRMAVNYFTKSSGATGQIQNS